MYLLAMNFDRRASFLCVLLLTASLFGLMMPEWSSGKASTYCSNFSVNFFVKLFEEYELIHIVDLSLVPDGNENKLMQPFQVLPSIQFICNGSTCVPDTASPQFPLPDFLYDDDWKPEPPRAAPLDFLDDDDRPEPPRQTRPHILDNDNRKPERFMAPTMLAGAPYPPYRKAKRMAEAPLPSPDEYKSTSKGLRPWKITCIVIGAICILFIVYIF